MKRLLESEKVKWLYSGDKPKRNTIITFGVDEIPIDLDLTGFDVGVYNILWSNCCAEIKEFDDYENIIKLELPRYFQVLARSVRKQTQDSIITHLRTQMFEDEKTIRGEEIWYDNVIGLNPRTQAVIGDAILAAWDTCRSKGFEPNIKSRELVKHLVKFLAERQAGDKK